MGILTWIKIGAVLLAVGSFAWLVDDYGYQRHRAEKAEGAVETLAAANAGSERAIRHLEAERQADAALTRAALDRRDAVILNLSAQHANQREIVNDPSCPLPANLRGTLGIMLDD